MPRSLVRLVGPVVVAGLLVSLAACATTQGAMTPAEGRAFVDRMLALVSAGKIDQYGTMVDDAYVGHQSAMTFGNAEVKAGHTALRKAMPDLKLTAEEVIVAGDKLILRMVWKGTFTGEYMGKPPTGKQVTNWSINIWRIKDGKIVEEWCQGDDLGLMKQLGVLP